jgi:1,2-diacylglycerol 3-alpha-glucosyltransferase
MRILITGETYYPALNGQAIFTTNLAEGLVKRGHEVLMVYSSEKGLAYRSQRNGVHLEAIKSVSLRKLHENAYFTAFPGKDVQRILNAFQPEIIHIQDHYLLSRSFVKTAEQYGIKCVGTNHFMPENLAPYVPLLSKIKPLYNHIFWQWMLEVYNHVEVATAQSKASAALVRSEGLHRPIFPVSCGIDLERFHPDPLTDRAACRARYGLDVNRKIFLFVGRVDKEKKLDVLLKALSILQRDDIQLAIAGRGAALNELQKMTVDLNIQDRVVFTGFVSDDDLPALLNSIDIFTMPSEAELLSIASLEAMASGKPVLLADAVALPELVTNGVNGYLFNPGDYENAAKYMALLADHPEHWADMGKASLEKSRYHSLDNIIRQYEMIYEALVTNAPLSSLKLDLEEEKVAHSQRLAHSVG